jgi:hypothetical protein
MRRAVGVTLGVYAIVLLAIGSFRVTGDGIVYYRFLERLLGADPPHPFAYQFGVAFWNLPFVGVAWPFGEQAREGAIAVGAAVALGLALAAGYALLRRFGLPRGAPVLLLALFGTPLFYYTLFSPSYSHAFDALLFTVACLLLVQRRPILLGGVLGLMLAVRYANLAVLPGMLVPLALRGRRDALLAAGSVAVAAGVAFLVPLLAGIDFANPGENDPTEPPREDLNASFDLLAPLRMLFSLHRGLFLWTPLTALGVAGFVLLLARVRRPELMGIGVAALSLLLVHVAWGNWWDGGWSFSQRFLTSLFPVFLLGLAELVRRRGNLAYAAAALCAGWSVFVGLNHYYGFEGADRHSSLDDVVRLYTHGERTPVGLARLTGSHIRERWNGR